MKQKGNKIPLKRFLLLFLVVTMLSLGYAEDSCPAGMRRMNLDDSTAIAYGVARSEIPALNFNEGNGALWFNRKVLLEPRFEVHLKASIDPIDSSLSESEQILEGFTIVISNAKNTVGLGAAETMGYYGFSKSYVIEFDFNKHSYDPDSSSFSLRYCDANCESDDRSAIKSGKLTTQRYDATKTMNWDFRLTYIDHVLTVYSGPNDVLLTYSVDLESKFGSYIANIGFTGYLKGNKRQLSLSGTFLCEDNFDMSQIDGKFYVLDTMYDTYNYKAGQKVMYLFQFKNNKGQVIPHCNKNDIWKYDFSLVVDCSASNFALSVKDDYNLILSMNACPEIGKHSIAITEASNQEGPTRYYNIEPGDIKTISLIGHDGTIANIETQVDPVNQAKILKYGPVSGDFSLTQSLKFILDFDILDSFGNTVDVGETSEEMLETSQLGLTNSNGAKITMAKKDTHYQLTISVVNTGTYQIKKNEYMTDAYELIVRAGEVDPRNSYCSIEGYTEPPTFQQGVPVTYSCYFRDSLGNTITSNDYESLSDYDFSCNAVKRKPTTGDFSTTLNTANNVYTCQFTPSVMGEYSFNGYMTKKGSTTKTELPAKINGFSVMPNFNKVSLTGAKVYNPNSLIWYDIDKFSFVYKADTNGFLTAVDLTDSDHTTLVSSYGKISGDFKFSSFSALLTSPHDSSYKINLVAKTVTLNGKEYIGIYTANDGQTDNVVKKSSFEYQIQFVWDGVTKSITMKYKFASTVTIGTDTTCFHDLSPEATQINFESVSLVNNNLEQLLGTMELRTTDGYLYNYDIGTNNIQIKLDPENIDVKFRVSSNVVLGTYNVYGSANATTFTGTLYFYVNGKECNQNVRAKAGNGLACTLKFEDPDLFTFQYLSGTKERHYKAEPGAYVDGFLNFHFSLYDKDEFMLQQINIDDCSVEINSLQWGTDQTKYICPYDPKRQSFNFKYTYLKYQNDLAYVITAKDCLNKYVIHYDQKSGGTVSMSSSSYTLLQKKINVGETAYIEVTLKDTNNILLGKTEGALENSRKGVRVYWTKDSETYEFTFDSITSAYTIRYKYTFDVEGSYTVFATYNGQELNIEDKTLSVILEKISLPNSQLYIILDSTILLSTQATQNVQSTTQIPRYKLALYNSENKAIQTYDQSTEVNCTMTYTNSLGDKEEYPLLVDKQEGYIYFVHNQETQDKYPKLVTGFYDIIITVGTETKKYQLYLAGEKGSEDASNKEDFDPSKTEFNVIEISGEAGLTYSVYLTFKASDGLRWNYPGELSEFTYSNSYKLGSTKLSTVAQKGTKNGQFIININQKTSTTGKAGNKLTIFYNGQQLSSQVTIIMKCSSLFSLVYDSGCEDGNVFNLPLLKFIPKDRYGNLYTDLFDSSKTDKSSLDRLIRGKSVDDVVLTTYNFVSDNKYLNVLYKTKVATTIEITSDYFSDTYTYKIKSGPIDSGKTKAELKTSSKVIAGSVHDIMIYPKDEFGNVVDYLTEEDLSKFIVWYQVTGNTQKYDFSDKCKLVNEYISSDSTERNLVEVDEVSYSAIQCSTTVDSVGSIQFYANYINDHIYAIGSTYTMGDSSDTGTTISKGTKGKFFVRLDGTIPTELQSHPTSEYGAAVIIDKVIKNATFTHSVSGEGVNFNLNQLPTPDQIQTSLKGKNINYNPDLHYVLWYVIKQCGDGWHIDGVLLQKSLVNLVYNANAPTGIWSNMPDGAQHEPGSTALVSKKIPTRKDGYFKEWNTAEDGSGSSYQPNQSIYMKESTTLYAQWITYDPLVCNSCLITLKSSQINFDNLRTVYTKTNTQMKVSIKTLVDSSTLPKFEITFYDQYNNVITNPQMVEILDLKASLGGTDVKLCVSNSDNKKLINVCPPSNGDDNYNKWYYLPNGDKYSLILNGPKTITYPLELTGGYNDGSSNPVELTNTYLDPTNLILPAGEEGTVFMELRTADKQRKNYWYPNINDNITISFIEDKDTCTYSLSKAEKPGQYYIKFSCTKKNNQNSLSVTIEGKELSQKVQFVINAGKSYYLEATNPELYDISGNKFTFKTKPINGEIVTFKFKLLDKYKNYLDYGFENTGTNVRSDLYGISNNLYAVSYNQNSYLFTDNVNEYVEKHSWEIQCLESDNKYYFIYGKVPGPVDPSKSDFLIDKTEYIIKETSTVEVILRDSYGVNVGIVEGRLEKEKQYLTVQASGESNTLVYIFDSISTKNTLIYKYQFQTVGNFAVTAEYNKIKIANKSIPIAVAYQKIDAKKSQLYITSTQEKLMSTTAKTIIDNLKEYPFYKFYFYTSENVKILNYDKNLPITCQMTKGSYKWDLTVTKENGYVKFNYKDNFNEEFKRLPTGDYSLLVTVDQEQITYPLYLIGENGSGDASPSSVYDRTTTLVSPVRIDGIAGDKYRIDVEFRAADGLRWNYEVQLSSLTIANSYGLSSKYLVLEKVTGEKKGQCIIYLIQYKATTGSPDNILTISYEGKPLSQKVNVAIKCNELANLVYDSGLRNSTVLDPPTLKFVPYDKYENLYTDLFDPTIYDEKTLQGLTVGTSRDGYTLSTVATVSDGKFLNVQYGSQKVTTIDVTSPYFPDTYTYRLGSGPIDPETTYGELVPKTNKTAGSLQEIVIYPRDKYGNEIDDLDQEDVDKFIVTYEEVGTPNKNDISDTCKLAGKSIKCSSPINEAGEIQFKIDYVDDPVNCKDCLVTINPGVVDFLKTTVVFLNTGKEMLTTTKTQIEVSTTPTFELTFHDQFNNIIYDEEVTKKVEIQPFFLDTDINLCIADKKHQKQVTVCKTEDGENVNKWYYLVNGDNYFLKLSRKDEELKLPVEIIGGAKEGSSSPVYINRTYVNPTSLTLTAGVEDKITLELRTSDNKQKNYWFLKPEDHIKASFDKDKDTCSYKLNQGDKIGQYYIYFKCTKKIDENVVTITIDNEDVPQKVTLKVIPAEPAKALLFYMNDEEIKQESLGTVTVEEQLKIKEVLFDEFDNRITEINFPESVLGINFQPVVAQRPDSIISATPSFQNNGEIIITMTSTLACQHVLKGAFFPLEKYTVLFTHGKPSAENSLLIVEKKEITAGETDKVFIYPYDQYNNKIDAKELLDNNPYQVSYITEGSTTKIPIDNYDVETIGSDNVLAYSATFTKAGIDTAYGYIGTAECKCSSCVINVSTAEVEFLNNDYKRFESTINDFQSIKNGTVEKNTKNDPIYRIYPKDSYDNAIEFIPEEKLRTYTCYLVSKKEGIKYDLKLNNQEYTNQAYAEFVKDDSGKLTYSQLVGGVYYLYFENQKEQKVFEVILEGSSEDTGASNKDPEPQNTHINSFNLKYTAGQKGDMYVELRTEDNLRRNSWDGYEITVESCNKDDQTFKYNSEKAGTLGVFYITVTTKKANTYPKSVECPLTIKVNGEVVENLHPAMEVTPADIYSTEILSDYYKDVYSNKILKDGTADSNYVFEVKSFDIYGNLCPTVQEKVGIKIILLGDEVKSVSDDVPTTGFRKYTVSTTKTGVYTVTSAMNPAKGGMYLPNDSIFNIYPGELYRTVIEAVTDQIKAGEKPAVYIQSYDKNDNTIPAKDFKDKFTVEFYDSKNEVHGAAVALDQTNELKAIYTSKTPVTIVGTVTCGANYNVKNEKVDTSHISILVVAGDPDPSKSVLTREVTKGSFTTYKNGDSFIVDTNELLILNVTLYDTYGNRIYEIPTDSSVLDPTMSGNDMDPIFFDSTKKTDYFNLDYIQKQAHIDTFSHLVDGNYDLVYDVKTSLGKASFKYTLIVANGDTTHGNGPICSAKLSPDSDVSFYAGDTYSLTLELRTCNGLLYNREIDPSDVAVTQLKTDQTFKYSIYQAGDELGIYTIDIYSEKKGKYTFNAVISSGENKHDAGTVNYRVLPGRVPCPEYTVILVQPESEISPETSIEITFLLADKYNNQFEERNDIIENNYLYVTNNENIVTKATKDVSEVENGNKFRVTLNAIYPPNLMHINTVYNDGSNSVVCFPQDIITEIRASIENTLTKVTSRNALKIMVGDTLDMQIYVYDRNGFCLDNDDYSSLFTIAVTGPLESVEDQQRKEYYVRKVEDPSLDCQNKYEIITTPSDKYTKTGTYNIKVTSGDYTVATYTQICYTTGYSIEGFLLKYVDSKFDPDSIPITDTIRFIVSGSDEYGNEFNDPLIDDMTMSLPLEESQYIFEKVEVVSGQLQFNVNIHKVGSHQLHLYFKGEEVYTVNMGELLPIFTVLTGACRAENNDNIDTSPTKEADINRETYILINCTDIYGNNIDHGGETFTSYNTLIVSDVQTPIDSTVVDNNDGTYTVKFTPPLAGTYVIKLLVGDNERYGEDVQIEITKFTCSGKTPYKCPNKKECVSNMLKCIPSELTCDDPNNPGNPNPDTPFLCKVNGVLTCVKSRNECDCPEGYYKCTDFMTYCVPQDRQDMCPFFLQSSKLCRRLGTKYVMFPDGICRLQNSQSPSMPVCPLGKVLCADLSCRDNYDECYVSPECDGTQVRCADQTCASSAKFCPSIITCANEGDVACPNSECQSNEVYCEGLPLCSEDAPYLCRNLQCAAIEPYCSKRVACGDSKVLCEDNICRTTC